MIENTRTKNDKSVLPKRKNTKRVWPRRSARNRDSSSESASWPQKKNEDGRGNATPSRRVDDVVPLPVPAAVAVLAAAAVEALPTLLPLPILRFPNADGVEDAVAAVDRAVAAAAAVVLGVDPRLL